MLTPGLKALGFNQLEVHPFQSYGFNCQPAPLHREKLLVFSTSLDTLDEIEEYLEDKKVRYLRIEGKTSAVKRKVWRSAR